MLVGSIRRLQAWLYRSLSETRHPLLAAGVWWLSTTPPADLALKPVTAGMLGVLLSASAHADVQRQVLLLRAIGSWLGAAAVSEG